MARQLRCERGGWAARGLSQLRLRGLDAWMAIPAAAGACVEALHSLFDRAEVWRVGGGEPTILNDGWLGDLLLPCFSLQRKALLIFTCGCNDQDFQAFRGVEGLLEFWSRALHSRWWANALGCFCIQREASFRPSARNQRDFHSRKRQFLGIPPSLESLKVLLLAA